MRFAVVLLIAFTALAERFGLEEYPWSIPRRRRHQHRRPGLREPSALPDEARGDRLRLPHPGILHQQRDPARPQGCSTTRPRCCACRLPARAALVRGLPALLYVRTLGRRPPWRRACCRRLRCRSSSPRPDRHGPRPHLRRDKCRDDQGRPVVGAYLPSRCPGLAAQARGRLSGKPFVTSQEEGQRRIRRADLLKAAESAERGVPEVVSRCSDHCAVRRRRMEAGCRRLRATRRS